MLKNISIHQKKNYVIKPEWIEKKILKHENIPDKIYQGLNILSGLTSQRTNSNIPSGVMSPYKLENSSA